MLEGLEKKGGVIDDIKKEKIAINNRNKSGKKKQNRSSRVYCVTNKIKIQ